jgi:ribosomal protein S18 acetylase RimI-like enzyme
MTMSEDKIVDFRNIPEVMLMELGVIHRVVMSYSLNARIGERHLLDLYKQIQKDDNVIGKVLVRNGRAVGLCLGTTNILATQNEVKKCLTQSLISILNPLFMIRNVSGIIDSIHLFFRTRKIDIPANYILLWFIDPGVQGLGLGRLVLNETLENIDLRNKSKTFVDVRKTSFRAIESYRKVGFENYDETILSLILSRYNRKS